MQKPFDAELQLKNLKITASFDHADTGNLSTDWSVFQCSLFHLLSNAIKHGKQGSSIQIDVSEKEGLLVFAITNFCETLSLKGWEKAMSPVFAFERLSVEVNETSGVGIGISTATTLAEALGGSVDFKVDFNLKKVVSSIKLRPQPSSDVALQNDLLSPAVIGVRKFKMSSKNVPQVSQ